MNGQIETKRTSLDYDLAELYERFLEDRQRPSDPRPLAPKTVRSYEQALKAFRATLTQKSDHYEVEQAIRALIDHKLTTGGMSASGMNVYLRAYSSDADR